MEIKVQSCTVMFFLLFPVKCMIYIYIYIYVWFIQNCHQLHHLSVYFCIFSHWENSRVLARNAVNMLLECRVGLGFSRSHCWIGASAASIRATAQFLTAQTQKRHTQGDISTSTHMHLTFTHRENSRKLRHTATHPWIEQYVLGFFIWGFSVFLNISLSHPYHSVIFLIKYMNFYRKDWLQSYNRVSWCRKIYLTMTVSSKIKCSSSVKRLL